MSKEKIVHVPEMEEFWRTVEAPLRKDGDYLFVPCWLDEMHDEAVDVENLGDGDDGRDALVRENTRNLPTFTAICQQIKLHGPESFEAAYRLGGGIAVMSYLEELERGGS